jgi:hypothetical protein
MPVGYDEFPEVQADGDDRAGGRGVGQGQVEDPAGPGQPDLPARRAVTSRRIDDLAAVRALHLQEAGAAADGRVGEGDEARGAGAAAVGVDLCVDGRSQGPRLRRQ